MKNTWLSYALMIVFILAMFTSESHALTSKTRVRMYRKTLHEIIEKNGAFITDYASNYLGNIDIGDKSIQNAVMSIRPQGDEEELDTVLKFIEGKGIELTINEFKFNVKGEIENKIAEINGNIDSIFFRIDVKQKEKNEATSHALFDLSTIPQFEINSHEVNFDENSIKWSINGVEQVDSNLTKLTIEWLNLSIKGQLNALKILFNSSQLRLANYVAESFNLSGDNSNSFSFSGVDFYDEYLEIAIESKVEIEKSDESLFRTNEEGVKSVGDKINALEMIFDENLINFWSYSLFQSDKSIGLRKVLRTEDKSNEYASVFDNILMTQVVSQAWNEMETEFGKDKRIDAQCSFGKSLFKDQIKDIKPPKINFLKNSKIDFTFGFGCSILVENEPGEWENFRSFYGELYIMLKLNLKANDAAKSILLSGNVEDLKALRLKIFKQSSPMVTEELTLSMLINMGLGMLKNYADKALEIPQLGYPEIKECTGLTLLRPSINIHDRYIVFSFDLGVKPVEKNCDLLIPPSIERIEPEEKDDLKQVEEDLERIKEDL